MRIFSYLYDKALIWSRHAKAPWFLGGVSFAESSFFPIPPDIMLAPMCLAQPNRAVFLATLTTVTSVVGGILGYMIGLWGYAGIEPVLQQAGYMEKVNLAREWFEEWGFWAIFIAGFSPVPYKVFTITAGAMGMAFAPFVMASFIGRGSRFYLVALLMAWGGEAMQEKLRRWVDVLGWLTIGLIALVILFR
jgi:membrane protein YqaA with SNARE-associated domain